MIGAILKKEFLVFFRNVGLVVFILYSFLPEVYVAGNGIKVTPQNVSVGYVNYTNSKIVQDIITSLKKPQFQTPILFTNEKELKQKIFNREIMIGIVFDKEFVRNIQNGKIAKLQVLVDATAAAQAQVSLVYLQNILMKFEKLNMPVEVKIVKLFNPNSNEKWFMSVTELLSVITLIGVILVAAVFVREKEKGTWDIMLLMPVDAKVLIFAKIFSQIVVLMVGVFLSVGIVVFGIFDTPINGNLWHFFLATFLFSFSIGGIALVIAAVSRSVLEVGQLSLIVMMPLIFLSGTWTPIEAMAKPIQFLSIFSPLRYYIEATQAIFFKGATLDIIASDLISMSLIGIVLFYIGYRKIGRLF